MILSKFLSFLKIIRRRSEQSQKKTHVVSHFFKFCFIIAFNANALILKNCFFVTWLILPILQTHLLLFTYQTSLQKSDYQVIRFIFYLIELRNFCFFSVFVVFGGFLKYKYRQLWWRDSWLMWPEFLLDENKIFLPWGEATITSLFGQHFTTNGDLFYFIFKEIELLYSWEIPVHLIVLHPCLLSPL